MYVIVSRVHVKQDNETRQGKEVHVAEYQRTVQVLCPITAQYDEDSVKTIKGIINNINLKDRLCSLALRPF